jgi:autotransporter-associated beta strand protein
MKTNTLLTLAVLTALTSATAQAGVVTKAPSGTDLNDPNSWSEVVTPTPSDIATWNSLSLNSGLTLGAATNWGAIDIEGAAGAIGITGSALTLSGGLTVQGVPGSGIYLSSFGQDLGLGNPLTLGASQMWTVGSGRMLTASNIISGSAMALTLSGPGAFTLNGANTFSGGATVTNGCTVTVGNAAAFGTGTLTLGGGSINFTGKGITNPVYVPAGASVNAYFTSASATGGLNGALTGSGTILNNNPTGPTKNFFITGDISAFAGTIDLENGNDNPTLGSGTAGSASYNGSQAHFIVNCATTHPLNFGATSGTFQMGDLSGTGGLIPYNAHTVQVGALNTSTTFAGSLYAQSGGSLAFAKVGAGTQILGGANIKYGGATTVSAGTLMLSNATAFASAVTVSSGATLAGTGNSSQAVTLSSGGSLAPGLPGALGTLNLGSTLTLNATSTNALRINRTSGALTNDQVRMTGASGIAFSGTLLVTANAGSDAFQVGDKFILFAKNAGSFTGGFVSSNLPPLASGLVWSLGGLTIDGSILVVNTNVTQTPVFSLASGGYMGAQTVTISSEAGSTVFYTTDGSNPTNTTPTHGALASGFATVSVPVPTAGMTVRAYATNSSKIDSAVATAVYATVATPTWLNTAGGSWTNTANWSNNVVASGTGVTADFAQLTLTSNTTLTLDGARTIGALVFDDQSPSKYGWTLNTGSAGSLTLAVSTNTPVLSNNVPVTIASTVAGTQGLTKTGNGTLTLSGTPSFTGGTTINNGRLVLLDAALPAYVNPSTTNNANAVLEWNVPSARTLGAANLNFTGAGVVQKTGSAILTIGFNSGDRTHMLSLSAGGVLDVQTGDLNVGWAGTPTFSANHGGLYLASGATLHNSQAGGMQFDWLSGSGSINNGYNSTTPVLTIGTDGAVNNAAYGVTNHTSTFSGVIGYAETYNTVSVGTLKVVKTGSGTQILTGFNGWTGATTVSNGTLLVNSPGALAGTPVTVYSGATFGGDGSLGGTLEIKSGGRLMVGTDLSTNAAVATLTIANTLTLNAGCTNVLRISKTGGSAVSDKIAASTAYLQGTLVVTNITADLNTPGIGDYFYLLNPGANGHFDNYILPSLPFGLSWDVSQLATAGYITVNNKTALPVFSPTPGGYIGAQLVTITCATPGATIHYSTDFWATTNTYGGPLPVPVNSTANFQAYATAPNYLDSDPASASYATEDQAVWLGTAFDGSWATSGNWTNNISANGRSGTALFNTLTLGADTAVTLDGSWTIGHLAFGDVGGAFNWLLNQGSAGTLTLDATNAATIQVANMTTTIGAVLGGTNGFTKTGAGQLALNGVNTFAGNVTVSQGSLSANSALCLGAGNNTVTLGDANTGANAVGLIVGTNVTGAVTLAAINTTSYGTDQTITLNAGSGLGGASELTVAAVNLNGNLPLTLKAINTGGHASAFPQDINYRVAGSGIAAGSTALVLDGTTWPLRTSCATDVSPANNFTGDVLIKGTVTTQNRTYVSTDATNQNLGFLNNNVTLDPGSRWNIVWGGETIGGLNGSGTNVLNCQNALNNIGLTLGNNNANGSFSGVISGTGWGVLKVGTGTQILGGASTYTGATVVSNGTLMVDGSLASGSTVSVAPAGTLAGAGTVGGSVTVLGTVSPGDAVGTLTTGSQTWYDGSTLVYQVASADTNNPAGRDLLTINGALDLERTNNGVFTIKLVSMLNSTTPGNVPDFDGSSNYSWRVGTATGLTNPGNLAYIVLDTSGFSNAHGGTFTPAFDLGTQSILINYTPATVNTAPTALVSSVSGSSLTLSWPQDHTGWTLQSQTNSRSIGLTGTWFDVAGSAATNQMTFQVDRTKPTVFYRLVYP